MTLICNNCKVIFPTERGTCPRCGTPITETSVPRVELEQQGFQNLHVDLTSSFQNASQNLTFTIDDSDLLDSISHSSHTSSREDHHSNMDFFSKLPENTGTSSSSFETVPDPELDAIHQEQIRLERDYRNSRKRESVRNFNWHRMFRILLSAAIIFALITVWNQRYIILGTIIRFVSSTLPTIIVICIIVYAIRHRSGR